MLEPIHKEPHPLGDRRLEPADEEAGTAERIVPQEPQTTFLRGGWDDGVAFTVEDWADRMLDRPWADDAAENGLCALYAERVAADGLPDDDEVVYGNLTEPDGRQRPILVHITELGD